MPETFKTKDGKSVRDGETVALTLQHGTETRAVRGVVRSFYPDTERIAELEAQIKKLKEDNILRWEISNDDPTHPAIGFLPENVLTRTES